MRSLKLYVTLFSLVFQSIAFAGAATRSGSSPVEKCLNVSTNLTTDCMNQHLKPKTINNCYKMSETIFSNQSKENVKNYCFYNISEFPTLKTCVDSAKKFYIAENKDQALFECVRQFASSISVKNCMDLSKMMTYKEKSNYLAGHCSNL
jgi:hypothetical protein